MGAIVGFTLFLVAFPVLWWNEGRAVRTHKSLQEGAGAVIPVFAGKVDRTNEGKLVHLSGRATTTEVLADPFFKVSANALRLRREVQMYQWVEDKRSETRKKLGGGEETTTTYSYDKQWSSRVVQSSSFKRPAGHENPGFMRHESASWNAATVTLGAFTMNPSLRDDIGGSEPVPVTPEVLAALGVGAPVKAATPAPARGKRRGKPAALSVVRTASPGGASAFKADGEGLYLGADPASPAVGDLRIRWTRVAPTDVSVIARQSGSTFGPYQTAAGKPLEMLSMGTVSAPQMFANAEQANVVFSWLLRAGGFLLMLFGVYSLMKPFAVVADIVPFIGSLLRVGLGLFAFVIAAPLSLMTIAVAWIFYRPLLGALLAGGALALIVGGKALASRLRSAPAPAAAFPAAAGRF
jgi:hypothetical protein